MNSATHEPVSFEELANAIKTFITYTYVINTLPVACSNESGQSD